MSDNSIYKKPDLDKKRVSEVASYLGRLSHKKKPRGKQFYVEMQKKSVISRKKRLSPPEA